MSALVKDEFGAAIDQVSRQCDVAIERVAQISDQRALGEAKIALTAATELARMNGMTRALRIKLTRLELHIARRAGQLGVTVKGVTGTVAKWYADKTDAEIDALIDRHMGKSAPASIMRAEKALSEFTSARASAAQFESIGRLKVGDAGESLAAIVTAVQDELYDRPHISVDDMTEYVERLVGVPTFDEDVNLAGLEGLRIGLWEAVRKALASGELDDPRLDGLPRWITCKGRDDLAGDRRFNLRVPTAKATLYQLDEYVELLNEKARQTSIKARRIAEILDRLRESVLSASAIDGEGATLPDSVTVGEAAFLLTNDLFAADAGAA